METEFKPFSKIARLSREVVVTEKLDGTNAQILIVYSAGLSYDEERFAVVPGDRSIGGAVSIFAGSRNRWLSVHSDNFGFAKWVVANAEELKKLGEGRHYGEWWGNGIQRGYGLNEKRFSLFNVSRWISYGKGTAGVFAFYPDSSGGLDPIPGPKCCHVVPTIWRGDFDTQDIERFVEMLRIEGSFAAPGFKNPEGVVIYHTASGTIFKKTCVDDEKPKTLSNQFNAVAQ